LSSCPCVYLSVVGVKMEKVYNPPRSALSVEGMQHLITASLALISRPQTTHCPYKQSLLPGTRRPPLLPSIIYFLKAQKQPPSVRLQPWTQQSRCTVSASYSRRSPWTTTIVARLLPSPRRWTSFPARMPAVTTLLLRAVAAAPERATQSRTRTPRLVPLKLHAWCGRHGMTVRRSYLLWLI
jgi:hypothetical protein